MGKARDLLGVDNVSINDNKENTTNAATIGVGKYIGDNIYLELERGAQIGSSKARVEVKAAPHIFIESVAGETGDRGIGVNWKYDY